MKGWAQHRPLLAGFHVSLPQTWEVTDDAGGAGLQAHEPERAGLYRAHIAVRRVRLEPHWDQQVWLDVLEEQLRETLDDFYLLDAGEGPAGGLPSWRTLAHYDGGEAVTLEQWAWYGTGRGYLLTANCGTLDYDDLADVFAMIATTFEPVEARWR